MLATQWYDMVRYGTKPANEGRLLMSELLTPAEVAIMLGISETMLKRYRLKGTGPQPTFISPRIIKYRPEAITAWIDKQEGPANDNDNS